MIELIIKADAENAYQTGYEEGHHDGYNQAMSEMPNIIRCKDCKYWWYGNYCDKHGKGQENADWFCADGERKE